MNSEFVGISEASTLTGMHRVTLRRRIQRGDLQAFRNPRDERFRLLRVRDLKQLMAPRPERMADALLNRPGHEVQESA